MARSEEALPPDTDGERALDANRGELYVYQSSQYPGSSLPGWRRRCVARDNCRNVRTHASVKPSWLMSKLV